VQWLQRPVVVDVGTAERSDLPRTERDRVRQDDPFQPLGARWRRQAAVVAERLLVVGKWIWRSRKVVPATVMVLPGRALATTVWVLFSTAAGR
jgi:hypothetical protein